MTSSSVEAGLGFLNLSKGKSQQGHLWCRYRGADKVISVGKVFPEIKASEGLLPGGSEALSVHKATRPNGRCPCLWRDGLVLVPSGWNWMVFMVPSSPNHSVMV